MKMTQRIQRSAAALLFAGVAIAAPNASAAPGASPTHSETGDKTAGKTADRFESFLKSIDVVPPGRAAFEATFPNAKARLLVAATDARRDTWTRTRAISLLSYFRDADVRAALLSLATDPAAATSARREAIYTAGRTFGSPGDPALIAALEGAAGDAEAEVRGYAVRALRWVDHVDADAALARIAEGDARPDTRTLAAHVRLRRDARLADRKPRGAKTQQGHR